MNPIVVPTGESALTLMFGRPDVRPRVQAGSVIVAVRQTVVTGTSIPTGWHSVAHTPVPTFQPGNADPFRFRPGNS